MGCRTSKPRAVLPFKKNDKRSVNGNATGEISVLSLTQEHLYLHAKMTNEVADDEIAKEDNVAPLTVVADGLKLLAEGREVNDYLFTSRRGTGGRPESDGLGELVEVFDTGSSVGYWMRRKDSYLQALERYPEHVLKEAKSHQRRLRRVDKWRQVVSLEYDVTVEPVLTLSTYSSERSYQDAQATGRHGSSASLASHFNVAAGRVGSNFVPEGQEWDPSTLSSISNPYSQRDCSVSADFSSSRVSPRRQQLNGAGPIPLHLAVGNNNSKAAGARLPGQPEEVNHDAESDSSGSTDSSSDESVGRNVANSPTLNAAAIQRHDSRVHSREP